MSRIKLFLNIYVANNQDLEYPIKIRAVSFNQFTFNSIQYQLLIYQKPFWRCYTFMSRIKLFLNVSISHNQDLEYPIKIRAVSFNQFTFNSIQYQLLIYQKPFWRCYSFMSRIKLFLNVYIANNQDVEYPIKIRTVSFNQFPFNSIQFQLLIYQKPFWRCHSFMSRIKLFLNVYITNNQDLEYPIKIRTVSFNQFTFNSIQFQLLIYQKSFWRCYSSMSRIKLFLNVYIYSKRIKIRAASSADGTLHFLLPFIGYVIDVHDSQAACNGRSSLFPVYGL